MARFDDYPGWATAHHACAPVDFERACTRASVLDDAGAAEATSRIDSARS